MKVLHLALGTPQMVEELTELGRRDVGALRDLTILWLLLTASLIALGWMAWLTFSRGSFPDLTDVLKAVGLGVGLVSCVAMVALLVALFLVVGLRIGLAEIEILLGATAVLVTCTIAGVRFANRYGGRRRNEAEDR